MRGSLRRLGTDYLDLYLIHWPNGSVPLAETFKALNALVRSGKVRHLGVSNFNLKLLQEAQAQSEVPLFTNQVPLSVAERGYVSNGVLAYCQTNGILLTAYSPFEQNALRIGRGLASVASARGVSPYQIAIAWLASQPRVITIPMSANPLHQKENLRSADIVLSGTEIDLIG